MLRLISSIWWFVAATYVFWRIIRDGHTQFTIWTAIPILVCLGIYCTIIDSLLATIRDLSNDYRMHRMRKKTIKSLRQKNSPEQLEEMLRHAEALVERLNKQHE